MIAHDVMGRDCSSRYCHKLPQEKGCKRRLGQTLYGLWLGAGIFRMPSISLINEPHRYVKVSFLSPYPQQQYTFHRILTHQNTSGKENVKSVTNVYKAHRLVNRLMHFQLIK